MTEITLPVGLGGGNQPVDTHYIQSLLNKKLPPAAHRGGKLVEDGTCGKNTKTAIRDVQQFIMKVAHPDPTGMLDAAKLNLPTKTPNLDEKIKGSNKTCTQQDIK
ncbi:MAG TPA: hypothetical protein VN030_14010 [Cellvibrio sp.]|nr:hypothetical protein [Cellvibrio sp.]